MKDKILKDLDSDQLKVVNHKNGPLLVVAGPGSGKTLALTRRIANTFDRYYRNSKKNRRRC